MKDEKKLLDEKEFQKLSNPSVDLEKEKKEKKEKLYICYKNIVDVLREYIDMEEKYYRIVALWIIGTYSHQSFITYPYLFINATKGSGKTRLLKIIRFFAKDGEMLNSITEAVLFRTTGTLCIDEFEGIGRKGNESLRELLNSAYKKGTKVKRMKQKKTIEGVIQVVEEFDVYRPIAIANIWGMESVLADRCIKIVLEKSSKKKIINLLEIFEYDLKSVETKKMLVVLGGFIENVVLKKLYKKWNILVKRENEYENTTNTINNIYNINTTNTTTNTNTTNTTIYRNVQQANIHGRNLELSLPFLFISEKIEEKKEQEKTLFALHEIMEKKDEEDKIENIDYSLIEFVSKRGDLNNFISLSFLLNQFRNYIGTNEDWINAKWFGRALLRLNLVALSRRVDGKREIILNIKKAQEKTKIFK